MVRRPPRPSDDNPADMTGAAVLVKPPEASRDPGSCRNGRHAVNHRPPLYAGLSESAGCL